MSLVTPNLWPLTQRVLAAGALVVVMPLIIACYVAMLIESGRPGLFMQTRIGRHGRFISIPKIRTMARGSESRTALGVRSGDHSVTRLGSWMRRLKLDELPQLWTVARGDLALVGPRPLPVALESELCRRIPGFQTRRSVKPGLTSLAQLVVPIAAEDADFLRNWEIRSRFERRGLQYSSPILDTLILTLTAAHLATIWTRIPRRAAARRIRASAIWNSQRPPHADESVVW